MQMRRMFCIPGRFLTGRFSIRLPLSLFTTFILLNVEGSVRGAAGEVWGSGIFFTNPPFTLKLEDPFDPGTIKDEFLSIFSFIGMSLFCSILTFVRESEV